MGEHPHLDALEQAWEPSMGEEEDSGQIEKLSLAELGMLSPREALELLRTTPLISAEQGERWRQELRQAREEDSSRA